MPIRMKVGVRKAYADHSLRISNSIRRAPRRRRRIGRSAVTTAISPRGQTPGPVTPDRPRWFRCFATRSRRGLKLAVRLLGGRLQLLVDVALAVDAVRQGVRQRARVD